MLCTWGAVNDKPVEAQSDDGETNEAREGRLRHSYLQALALHSSGRWAEAKDLYQVLATELSQLVEDGSVGGASDEAPAKVGKRAREGWGEPARPKKLRKTNKTGTTSDWIRSVYYAVHRNLGDVLCELGTYSSGMRAYDRALQRDPEDVVVWLRAGRAAVKCGYFHFARRALEHALTVRPTSWVCQKECDSLLHAIGDADEDLRPAPSASMKVVLDNIYEARVQEWEREQEKDAANATKASAIERIQLNELSWTELVETVSSVLEQRIRSVETPIGAPLGFFMPKEPTSMDVEQAADASVDNRRGAANGARPPGALNPSSSRQRRPSSENEVSLPADTSGTKAIDVDAISDGRDANTAGPDAPGEPVATDKPKRGTGANRGEVRKSKRQEELGREQVKERLRDREQKGTGTRPRPADWGLTPSMLEFVPPIEIPSTPTSSRTYGDLPSSEFIDLGHGAGDQEAHDPGSGRPDRIAYPPWHRSFSEADEVLMVKQFISDASSNGGPVDIIGRLLRTLLTTAAAQFLPQIAKAWLAYRYVSADRTLSMSTDTLLVVEALMSSADKAAKLRRTYFHEAHKLLCAVPLQTATLLAESEISRLQAAFESLRVDWCRCQLGQRQGEMEVAAQYASSCLRKTKGLELAGVLEMPHFAGPLLSGVSISVARSALEDTCLALEDEAGHERARAHLRTALKSNDRTQAQLAIEEVRRFVFKLARMVDRCQMSKMGAVHEASTPSDPQMEPTFDGRLEAEGIAQECTPDVIHDAGASALALTKLETFARACSLCQDDVGELVSLTIQTTIAALRCHPLSSNGHHDGSADEENQARTPAKDTKMAQLVAIIRPFVAAVRKTCVVGETKGAAGVSGVSLEEAGCFAARTLVAATHVLQFHILALPPSTNTPTELSASEKNQRLAFSRAVLGFARSTIFVHHGETPRPECPDERSERDPKLDVAKRPRVLDILSFALGALAPRGCMRADGTSGALVRLYMSALVDRLSECAHAEAKKRELASNPPTSTRAGSSDENKAETKSPENLSENQNSDDDGDDGSSSGDSDSLEIANVARDWNDVQYIRLQLAQCYNCVFEIQNLETLRLDDSAADTKWLADAFRLTRRISSAPSNEAQDTKKPVLDLDTCRSAFELYRPHLLGALRCQWGEGKKSKRARDVIAQLIGALPSPAPTSVPFMQMNVLDGVVSLALEGRGAVKELRDGWRESEGLAQPQLSTDRHVWLAHVLRMYHELYVLNVMSSAAAYEAEFKNQKAVERRKAPREALERLLSATSNDCVATLMSRPWSPGAWLVLGRLFLEVADVSLDEREIAASTFGVWRSRQLASGSLGDVCIEVLGQAEGCFLLAEALTKDGWCPEPLTACASAYNDPRLSAYSFGTSEWSSGKVDSIFASEHDLYGYYGIAQSRARRSTSIRAAIQFGKTQVLAMKLREERFRHRRWRYSLLVSNAIREVEIAYPQHVSHLAADGLRLLDRGLRLAFQRSQKDGKSDDTLERCTSRDVGASMDSIPAANTEVEDKTAGNPLDQRRWYYMMLRAKLAWKCGEDRLACLDMYADALAENRRVRSEGGESEDVEPFYKMHACRMKILLRRSRFKNADFLDHLERYKFRQNDPAPSTTEKGSEGAKESVEFGGSNPASSEARVRAIATDIADAMQHCRRQGGGRPYTEFYFKSVYGRALLLWKVLDDRKAALQEMCLMFRAQAAAKAMERGGDAAHRGYFFTIWNYRHTDTGFEVAIESERKYLRWRDKMLGLYAALLLEEKDARTLAGIISRLKRRQKDDLPLSGALLDDLIGAYAELATSDVLSSSEEPRSVPTVAVSERALNRAWEMYAETLRLLHGVRRARQSIEREPDQQLNITELLSSDRPRHEAVVANALRLEYVRWQAAIAAEEVRPSRLERVERGSSIGEIAPESLREIAVAVEACWKKWPGDSKLDSLVERRLRLYRGGDHSAQPQADSDVRDPMPDPSDANEAERTEAPAVEPTPPATTEGAVLELDDDSRDVYY